MQKFTVTASRTKILPVPRKFSKGVAIFIALIGVAVVLGWIIDSTFLKSILPNWVSMKFNTAIAFVLLGISLFFFQLQRKKLWWENAIARSASMLVVSIGVFTLIEYVFGVDLGIDQFFYTENATAIDILYPGRMGPTSAFALTALGLSLLYIRSREKISQREAYVYQIPVLCVSMLALLAFIGYLYGFSVFYGITPYTQMAIHATIAFLIAVLGILFLTPPQGVSAIVFEKSVGGVIARRLLPAALVIPLLLGRLILWGSELGYYEEDFLLPFMVIFSIIILSIVVWKNAVLLHHMDIARQQEITKLELDKAKDDAILESIGDGMIVTDKTGKILMMNPRACEMLDLALSQAIGKSVFSILTIEDLNGQAVPTKRQATYIVLMTGKKVFNASYSYIRKDMAKVPISVTVAPIILNDVITGAVAVFRDVGKERSIDRAKSEFVSLASHQLRSPLSSINWYAEMLLTGDVGEVTVPQRQYMEEIYHAGQRMTKLVASLLNVSRLELGTFTIEPQPVDMVAVAQSVINEHKPQIEAKKIKFSTHFDSRVPVFQADPTLLRIIFQNLVSNAVKYTPESGNITVTLSQENSSRSILFSVTDTGYGIPRNQQEKIFTKFFRADNIQGKNTEGTGLGLYIVKSILDHSGGTVWFESEENQGSTFHVRFPATGMKKKQGSKALQ